MTTEIKTNKWITCKLCNIKRAPWMIETESGRCKNCRQAQARKMRTCLNCDKSFLSESPENRICVECKESFEYASTVLGMEYYRCMVRN